MLIKSALLFCLALTTAVVSAAVVSAAESDREWRFRALLDDRDIGQHTFRLSHDGGGQLLTSEASFAVKFLFITAYDYSHSATERWSDGCLQTISAATDDNDTLYAVDGRVQDDTFVVKTDQGERGLGPCVMTFAYWNPDILEQRRLLNVQTGDYVDVEVVADGSETLLLNGVSVPAERYTLRAEDLIIRLWYAQQDRVWLKLESDTTQGYTLRYELTNPPAAGLTDSA